MAISAQKAHHRARRANALQRGDQAAADAALLDLEVAKAAEYIEALVDKFPTLTDEARAHLAGLIQPAGGAQ